MTAGLYSELFSYYKGEKGREKSLGFVVFDVTSFVDENMQRRRAEKTYSGPSITFDSQSPPAAAEAQTHQTRWRIRLSDNTDLEQTHLMPAVSYQGLIFPFPTLDTTTYIYIQKQFPSLCVANWGLLGGSNPKWRGSRPKIRLLGHLHYTERNPRRSYPSIGERVISPPTSIQSESFLHISHTIYFIVIGSNLTCLNTVEIP